jgi:acyl-CoA reductase-like NAD-dependent aldehyde dehydrogenase
METGYVIFIDALAEGSVSLVYDGIGKPCIFPTRVEAQREIADNLITRLQEFIDGQRDFEDAITVEEYVLKIAVLPDGSIQTCDCPG